MQFQNLRYYQFSVIIFYNEVGERLLLFLGELFVFAVQDISPLQSVALHHAIDP